jgi:hypothetical protein
MQCNVEFGYQLSNQPSKTTENLIEMDGTGTSGCKLTSSQQSDIKYANPDFNSYLAVALFGKIHTFVLQSHVYLYTSHKLYLYTRLPFASARIEWRKVGE